MAEVKSVSESKEKIIMAQTQTFVIENQNQSNLRLDLFLQEVLNITRSQIKLLIDGKKITVNGQCLKAGYKTKINDIIAVEILPPVSTDIVAEDIKLDVVYEDEYLAVINKPQGMVVHPAHSHYSGTLVNALLFNMKNLSDNNGSTRPGIVHRLDKDTSGLIMIAKDDKTHAELAKQIQQKICARVYHAITYGRFKNEQGIVENYLARGTHNYKKIFIVPTGQGKLAVTEYKVLQNFKGFSYVEFNLKTGRTHQIRVHCASLGHPIVGDVVYGKEKNEFNLKGQMLHAYKIKFIHPVTRAEMCFTCKEPDYFTKFLNNLQK